jgi:hypothetical protein
VAVLLTVPVAEDLIVPVSVRVTLPPEGTLTLWLMFPDHWRCRCRRRCRTGQVAPVIADGRLSVTVAPKAGRAAFETTIV